MLIKEAELQIEKIDPFYESAKLIRLGQLRLENAWRGDNQIRVAELHQAISICNSILEINPHHHDALCLRASVEVDRICQLDALEKNRLNHLGKALESCLSAIQNLPSCGWARMFCCDLGLDPAILPRIERGILTKNKEALLTAARIDSTALVESAELLRRRAITSNGFERVLLGRRSLLRLAICIECDTLDEDSASRLAKAGLRQLALDLGPLSISKEYGLKIRQVAL